MATIESYGFVFDIEEEWNRDDEHQQFGTVRLAGELVFRCDAYYGMSARQVAYEFAEALRSKLMNKED